MRNLAAVAVAFALSFVTGCLDGSSGTPYDMDVEWYTPNRAADTLVSAEVRNDGIPVRAGGSYAGTYHVTGDAQNPTVEICVEAQHLETVTSENNISCPGACSSQEWVAVTVPQCKDVPVTETHVVFELSAR